MQTPQLPVPWPLVQEEAVVSGTLHFQKPLALVFSHWDTFGEVHAVGAMVLNAPAQLVV